MESVKVSIKLWRRQLLALSLLDTLLGTLNLMAAQQVAQEIKEDMVSLTSRRRSSR